MIYHLDDEDFSDPRDMKNEYLTEGVSVVDDIPLEDKEAMDEFNFLNSEETPDWNPNKEKIEIMKGNYVQDRRRQRDRPPRKNVINTLLIPNLYRS